MLTFIENESILLFVVRQESLKDTRDYSSAGRASALQAEGHRFESYWSHLYARYLRYVYAAVAELADAQDLKSCSS